MINISIINIKKFINNFILVVNVINMLIYFLNVYFNKDKPLCDILKCIFLNNIQNKYLLNCYFCYLLFKVLSIYNKSKLFIWFTNYFNMKFRSTMKYFNFIIQYYFKCIYLLKLNNITKSNNSTFFKDKKNTVKL